MKKRILLVIVSIFVLYTAFFSFTGCRVKLEQNPRLSELRSDILVAQNDFYKVTAVTGIRENPFSINGKSQKEKSEFTIITVTPLNLSGEFSYSATVNGITYQGKLVRHPYNQTYSCEINALNLSDTLEVAITGPKESKLTAQSIKTENFIDGEKAYSVAYSRLKKSIEAKAKTHDYEFFVRLIENPINSGGGHYWYVAFVFSDDKTYAALIDPITVEIAAVKD